MFPIRRVQRKRSELGSQARKGKFIRGERVGDWPLRGTQHPPFLMESPPMKNSLKKWSPSQRSGIWWSRSFEKIDTSEITGCHLGNLVSLKDHSDLFICLQGQHNEPSCQWEPCGPYQEGLVIREKSNGLKSHCYWYSFPAFSQIPVTNLALSSPPMETR